MTGVQTCALPICLVFFLSVTISKPPQMMSSSANYRPFLSSFRHIPPSARQVQNTGHRSQVAGHRKCIKKGRHCWAFYVYLFVSFPVTSQSGICLALTMLPVVLRVRELNGESYTLCWNLKSSFSRLDAWAGLFKA